MAKLGDRNNEIELQTYNLHAVLSFSSPHVSPFDMWKSRKTAGNVHRRMKIQNQTQRILPIITMASVS